MSYLDKDQAREYKEAKKFFGTEGIKLFLLLMIISAVLGVAGVGYKLTIGKATADANREVFEHNKSHVHAMIEDLSKFKLELARTEDEVERKAIINYIAENYATFDSDLIENDTLRQFLDDVMGGKM